MKTDLSQCQVMIDYDHAKVHEGKMFSFGEIAAPITTGATQYYLITAGDKEVHIRPAALNGSADKLTYEAFKGSNYTGGTAVPVFNRNQGSLNVASCSVTKSPTGSAEGTRFAGTYLPGAAGTGQSRSGSETSESSEVIIPANASVLIKFTNGSSATNLVTFMYLFYEDED